MMERPAVRNKQEYKRKQIKYMKKHLFFAAALLALAACNNEDYTPMDDPNTPVEIRLSSGIDVQTRANGVPDTQIAAGQQVGVFINDAGSSNDVVGANLKYNADGSGGLTLATDPAQKTPYYPANGNGVKMTAYHPYNAGAAITDNGYEFAVVADQSSNAGYYASDLLYSASIEYARQKTAHNIAFKHKLSKVECTLESGNGSPVLTGATVYIVNAKTNIIFKPADGTLNDPQQPATTSDIKLNSPAAGSYIGIIPPQVYVKGSQFLKVELSAAAGGGTFYYTIPNESGDEDLALAENKVYKYTIQVNRTGLSVTSTIEPWGDGGDYTGDAEM